MYRGKNQAGKLGDVNRTHLREVQHWREPRGRMPTRWSEDIEPVPSPLLQGPGLVVSAVLSLKISMELLRLPSCALHSTWQMAMPWIPFYGACHATQIIRLGTKVKKAMEFTESNRCLVELDTGPTFFFCCISPPSTRRSSAHISRYLIFLVNYYHDAICWVRRAGALLLLKED